MSFPPIGFPIYGHGQDIYVLTWIDFAPTARSSSWGPKLIGGKLSTSTDGPGMAGSWLHIRREDKLFFVFYNGIHFSYFPRETEICQPHAKLSRASWPPIGPQFTRNGAKIHAQTEISPLLSPSKERSLLYPSLVGQQSGSRSWCSQSAHLIWRS